MAGTADPEFGASRTRKGVTESLPVFYYDLGNPECYLAAELVNTALRTVPVWEPVLEAALGPPAVEIDIDALAQRIDGHGLQPLRWPSGWRPDTQTAMLAATYAKQIGRAVAFSLAAFRQAFAGGRDLADESTVLLAGAACEIHPAALLKGIALRSVREGLATANDRARAAGVHRLPAIAIDGCVFCGGDAVERAAATRSETP